MKRNGKWKRRGKSLGRRYEWFISRGRLIFRPGCGGNVLWKRRPFLSLLSPSRLSTLRAPYLSPVSPRDLLRLTQFNRVLPRTRVLVRHYSDRGAVYRSRASRRYFLWLELHTSRTPSARRAATITSPVLPGRFFNYCILERCCLPAARYFISPLARPVAVAKSLDIRV